MAGMVYGAAIREVFRSLGKRQLTRREGWDGLETVGKL
jgi:hypothetical protein